MDGVWRFILKENIRNFRQQLAREGVAERRATLQRLLAEAETELAELEMASSSALTRDAAALAMIAERAVDRAMELSGAQFGILQVYDEQRGGLVIVAQKNFRAAFLRPFFLTRPGDGSPSGQCFEEGQTIFVEDIERDPAFVDRRQRAREGGFKALLCSPVRGSSGKLLGVLSTQFTKTRSFSADDVKQMEHHGDGVGRELERRLSTRTT